MVFLKSNKKIRTDCLLWVQGRTGNTDNMRLEKLGIVTNAQGSIVVNENNQTHLPNIYAVGDIVGFPNLAGALYDQGRFTATHIACGMCDHQLVEFIPTGIYSIQEINSVGYT